MSNLIFLLFMVLFAQESFAQTSLDGHRDWVNSVVFSSDGKLLASGPRSDEVKLWDVENGELIATLEDGDRVSSVAFSPDGTLASGGVYDTVILWDVATHTNIATLEGHSDVVSAVDFSRDVVTLASGVADGAIFLWDISSYIETKLLFHLNLPIPTLTATVRLDLAISCSLPAYSG